MNDRDLKFFRGPDGTKYYYRDIESKVRALCPALVGKHIFEQLNALGLRKAFDAGTTPHTLPYSFAEEDS